jgi:hypothetical protein
MIIIKEIDIEKIRKYLIEEINRDIDKYKMNLFL